ncbi:hypothetical protein P280DRAFT_480811 [Massarina eburnea CBS 473.64]|uniref:Uncharacterized protein n=1 Tax=Massarina eburnea CBS 473.64 TaxID=1395130 RepID=A0A6A6RXT7_9PLEO|nr:hypothetical protein P280DRAFT_480811 [Massarina eburnea CBS 473.64]
MDVNRDGQTLYVWDPTPSALNAFPRAIRLFFDIVSRTPLKRLAQIKHVVIIETLPPSKFAYILPEWLKNEENMSMIVALLDFCEKNPQMEVHLRIPCFTFSPTTFCTTFMSSGYLLLDLFRDIDSWSDPNLMHPFFPDLWSDTRDRILSASGGKYYDAITSMWGKDGKGKNLRFEPGSEEGIMDEKLFARACKLSHWGGMAKEEQFALWMDTAKSWYTHGV